MGVPYTGGFAAYRDGVRSQQSEQERLLEIRLNALSGDVTSQTSAVRKALLPAQTSALASVRGSQSALASTLNETKPMAQRAKENAAYAGTFDSTDFSEVGEGLAGGLGVVGDFLGTPFSLGEKVSSGIGDLLGTNSALDREKARAYIQSYNAQFDGAIQPREFNTGNETIDAIRSYNRSDSMDLASGVQQIDAARQQHKDSLAALEAAARASHSASSGANQISTALTANSLSGLEAEKLLEDIKKTAAERLTNEVERPGKAGDSYQALIDASVQREDGRSPGEFVDDKNNDALTRIRRVEAFANALSQDNDLPLPVRAGIENQLAQNTGIPIDSTVRPRTNTTGFKELDEMAQSIMDFVPLVDSEGMFEDTLQRNVAPGNLTGQEAAEFALTEEQLAGVVNGPRPRAAIIGLRNAGRITDQQARQLIARLPKKEITPQQSSGQ